MSMQPIHSQIDINIEQIELDWVSNEYSSNNTNRNRLPKDETLNCLLDSIPWKTRERSKVYRDVFMPWSSYEGISLWAI